MGTNFIIVLDIESTQLWWMPKSKKIENRFNSGEITKDEAVRQVRSLQRSLRRKINKGTIKEKSTYGRLK